MNRVGVVKALALLLSVSAVLLPVVYGLNVYGWDIQALATPLYSPPRIDFRFEPSGLRFEGGQPYATFKLTHLGEVKAVFEGLKAMVHGPDGEVLAPATLDKAVTLTPNSTETLILKLNIDEAALKKLMHYFGEGRGSINVEVRGEALVRVFGSKVTAPISASFKVSLTDILS